MAYKFIVSIQVISEDRKVTFIYPAEDIDDLEDAMEDCHAAVRNHLWEE